MSTVEKLRRMRDEYPAIFHALTLENEDLDPDDLLRAAEVACRAIGAET